MFPIDDPQTTYLVVFILLVGTLLMNKETLFNDFKKIEEDSIEE